MSVWHFPSKITRFLTCVLWRLRLLLRLHSVSGIWTYVALGWWTGKK